MLCIIINEKIIYIYNVYHILLNCFKINLKHLCYQKASLLFSIANKVKYQNIFTHLFIKNNIKRNNISYRFIIISIIKI